MRDAIEQFRDGLRTRGIIPPTQVIARTMQRADVDGKHGKGDASYIFFDDGIPAGGFENHRDGAGWENWRADIGRQLSAAEVARLHERADVARHEREADNEQRRAEAREHAAAIWEKARPADAAHRYLIRKGIKPHGIRQSADKLVIPLRDAEGVLHSLQFIDQNGTKRYLPGGQVAGCYFSIGKLGGGICIAEGFATGASIYEAAGRGVAVAFDCGNLLPVARALREKFSDLPLMLCADDDIRTEGNPGMTKATEAARAIGGLLAIPDFGSDRTDGASDFNDLAQHRGREAVERALASAFPPQSSAAVPATRIAVTCELSSRDWPEPLPLPTGLPPVAPFDLALMPEALQPWARDICELIQCPPDFVAVATMTALGSVIGRKVAIRPQAHTDWTEVPNMWAMIVGRPGVLKSPAVEASLGSVRHLAALAAAEYEAALEGHELTAKVAKMQADLMAKAAANTLKRNPGADVSEMLRVDPPDEPTLRRYHTTDSTVAALGELLRQNPNGLLVHRDELVSLLCSLDQEDNAAARGFYLTGWNGNSPYTIDRIGRGMNLHIDAVCISILGSTQPGRIAEYLQHAVRGGKGDDGLVQRFGLLVWPDVGGHWANVDRPPDREAGRDVHGVFHRLDQLDWRALGAERDTGPNGDPEGLPYLRFDDGGQSTFNQWRTGLEARLRSGELHPALEAHLAKYRKLVPGLALISHLVGGEKGAVSERAVIRALAWAEYLETHACRAYASVVVPEAAVAKAIIKKLRTAELPPQFSSRDVWRPGWAMLSNRDQVADALRLLVDLDWLVTSRVETGGRTATVYHANPRGLQ